MIRLGRKHVLVWSLLLAGCSPLWGALTWTRTAVKSDDLAFSGLFAELPAGEKRFLSRAAMLADPGIVKMSEKPAIPIKAGDLVVLPLDVILAQLPLSAEADGIVLVCSDRWETFLPLDFVKKERPYLLLTFDGRTPEEGWPMFGNIEPLAPYFSNTTPTLGATFKGLTPYGMHDATQIVEIRAVNTLQRYAPFYAGPLEKLSPQADDGRTLFLRQCNNCHQGPGQIGGNVSQRPFTLLQIHATLNADYFRRFVRDPKKFIPNTMMPRHEDFTDDMLAQLIAFLSEAKDG